MSVASKMNQEHYDVDELIAAMEAEAGDDYDDHFSLAAKKSAANVDVDD